MPKINVAKAFNLKLKPQDAFLHFDVGVHNVDEEVAEHWYTKEHLAPEDVLEDAPAEAEVVGKKGRKPKAPAEAEVVGKKGRKPKAPAEAEAGEEPAEEVAETDSSEA